MRAVMISIQPKWVEKIANREKTIEVRKTAPKLKTPFKEYMYCTNDRKYKIAPFEFADGWHIKKYDDSTNYACGCTWRKREDLNGKVVGEFVCDKVYEIKNCGSQFLIDKDIALTNKVAKESCLDFDDMFNYLKTKDGYGLHISNLKIYDEPKELYDFNNYSKYQICKERNCFSGDCWICQNNAIMVRPPQSWCYVEE